MFAIIHVPASQRLPARMHRHGIQTISSFFVKYCLRFYQNTVFVSGIIMGLLLIGALAGCNGGGDATPDLDWLLGASSSFEITTEGMVEEAIAGTAAFQTDDEGQLVGIELIHVDDSTRGISIELEPHPVASRTYAVIAPELMGTDRPKARAGFTAFFEQAPHSFQATRGTLRVTQADASQVQGTFEMEMERQVSNTDGVATGDLRVEGSFQATRSTE